MLLERKFCICLCCMYQQQMLSNFVEDALEKHGVLVIPNQTITPAQQVAFSQAFAQLELTTHIVRAVIHVQFCLDLR